MGRSLRSHRSKKNNTNLRKKVFDPVETARSERLSEKLLKLAQQPKPPRQDMEVEGEAADAKDAEHKSDKKGQGEGAHTWIWTIVKECLLVLWHQ